MEFTNRVAVITGGGSGIGRAVAAAMARRDVAAVALVDVSDAITVVADKLNADAGRRVAVPFRGDATDETFRASVFDAISRRFGPVTLCVPAAGITRDDLAVRIDEGIQGSVVFIGSISSQGNRGQISYASTKAGLEGAAATIMKEAMFHGVRCSVIHPGFTDTPMVRAMGVDYVAKNILPFTQLGRLIRPDEIADAICFMLANAAVSGELWVDAGWHAPA
jgi:NAD(P)-dependent dehydrogenase (short-subunit alcohol dehydrogenase family)